MNLTVSERIVLLNILSAYTGNFATLKTIKKVKDALLLSEDEAAIWRPQFHEDGRFEWRTQDENGNPIKQDSEIEIGEMALMVIQEELKKLDHENKLKECHYALYERFVEGAK